MKISIDVAPAKLVLRESGEAGPIVAPRDSRLRGNDMVFKGFPLARE